MQTSKNCELFCKRKINLHCHTLIFFMFITSFTQTWLGLLETFSWYPWFFWTYPATRQQILNISLSRIFSWCNLAISMSCYLKNRIFWNRSRTFCPVPSENEIVGLDCIFSKTSNINSTISTISTINLRKINHIYDHIYNKLVKKFPID